MHHSRAALRLRAARSFALPGLMMLLAIGASVSPSRAQPTPQPVTGERPTPSTMQPFVIIFRQGPRELTDAEQAQRQQEVSAWAREIMAAGHRLDPRILPPEMLLPEDQSAASASAPDGAPVTALLFLVARDLGEAGRIAASHPGRKYGARVEVRPWAHPPNYRPAPADTES
jgi:hypothetical protein